jgi:phage protein U
MVISKKSADRRVATHQETTRRTLRPRAAILVATSLTAASLCITWKPATAGTITTSSTSLTSLNTFQPGGGPVTIAPNIVLDGIQGGTSPYDLTNQGTVSRSGTGTDYRSAVTLTAGGSITNQSGATISAANGYAIQGVLAPLTVTNAGTISANGQNYSDNTPSVVAAGLGVYLGSGGTVTNAATGRITTDFEGVYIAGGTGSSATVQNNGLISSRREGVYLYTTTGVINNEAGATIEATVRSGIRFGLPNDGIGRTYSLSNSGTVSGVTEGIIGTGTVNVTNAATGVISGATGISVDFGTTTITNSGRITGTGGSAINVVSGNSSLVNNQGATVDGTIAISSITNSGTIRFGSTAGTSTTHTFTNTATGTLVMKISETGQADKISVSGAATLQGGTVSLIAPNGAWNASHTYTLLTASGGVTGTFTNVDINQSYLKPTLTYSVNDVTLNVVRNSSSIQETVIGNTAAQQLSSSARRIASVIDNRHDGGARRNANRSTALGGSSSATDTGWTPWANFTIDFLDQNIVLPTGAAAQRVTGDSLSFLAGVDHPLGDRVLVGAIVGYETLGFDLPQSTGETRNKGPLIGAYAGVQLTDWASIGVEAGYAWQSNRISEAYFGPATPVKGEFDSEDIFVSSSIVTHKTIDYLIVSSGVNYTYLRRKFDVYTASDTMRVATPSVTLGRVTPNAELALQGREFSPYISAGYEWDIQHSAARDATGAILGAGLRFQTDRLRMSVEGNIQLERQGERSHTLSANIGYSF